MEVACSSPGLLDHLVTNFSMNMIKSVNRIHKGKKKKSTYDHLSRFFIQFLEIRKIQKFIHRFQFRNPSLMTRTLASNLFQVRRRQKAGREGRFLTA